MARLAIIEKASGKVVNIGDAEDLPGKVELQQMPEDPIQPEPVEGEEVDEAAQEFIKSEFARLKETHAETVKNQTEHNDFIDAHLFVFSDTAQTGDTWDGEKIVPQEPPKQAVSWDLVRAQRDALLQESDWTQLADSPLTEDQQTLWKQYRQSLRDLTKAKKPGAVVWPDKP